MERGGTERATGTGEKERRHERTSDRQVRQMHARPSSFDTNRSPIVSKRPSYTGTKNDFLSHDIAITMKL